MGSSMRCVLALTTLSAKDLERRLKVGSGFLHGFCRVLIFRFLTDGQQHVLHVSINHTQCKGLGAEAESRGLRVQDLAVFFSQGVLLTPSNAVSAEPMQRC
jgi:hypothetical protein